MRIARQAIDVRDPGSFAVFHQDPADHGVGQQSETAGALSIGNSGGWAIEVRTSGATVFARPAVVARLAAVVRFGDNRGATDGHHAAHFVSHAVAQQVLAAGHLHGRKEDAVGNCGRFSGMPEMPT